MHKYSPLYNIYKYVLSANKFFAHASTAYFYIRTEIYLFNNILHNEGIINTDPTFKVSKKKLFLRICHFNQN